MSLLYCLFTEGYQVQRFCFLILIPKIRPLDKNLLKKCQSKNSETVGFCETHLLQPYCSFISLFHFIIITMHSIEPIFLPASLILFLYLISYFSNFCTLLYDISIRLFCTACLPLPGLFSFSFKPCGFPVFSSGCLLLCCFSAFLHESFHFGF